MEVCPDDGARLIETDLEDQDDLLIGTIFDGRFQIQGKLGEGGMGAVYSARRLDFETDVALKLLKLDFARDDGIRKRFMYEARVISNLKHPHAVRLFDFGQADDGHVYMVMELLDGESLADRLAYRFVSYREVFDIITPICGVLGEAHVRDVIHRDLKPENIFLLEVEGNSEFPKLLDFGIAKHKREETMTKSGTLWGTPAYMSPEQAQGNMVGGAADIYGIAVMIYELISGNLPFQASTQMGFAVKHIKAPARALSTMPGLDSVPPALDDLLMEMLSKDPSQRPSSMKEVVRRLEAIREEDFDDDLLESIPAHEVDPIGLQAWLRDAPDVSAEMPTASFDSGEVDELGDTASMDVVGREGSQATRKGSPPLVDTASIGEGDGGDGKEEGAVRDREIAQTLAMHGEADGVGEEPTEDKAVEGGDAESAKVDLKLAGAVAAVVVMVGALAVWGLSGEEESAGVEEMAVTVVDDEDTPPVVDGEDDVHRDRAVRQAVSSSTAHAFSTILSAHSVAQQVNSEDGELDEDWEDDFGFIRDGEYDGEAEGDEVMEEDSRERLREALEGTF